MAYKYENNCVQCPDGCRSCGRKHQLVEVCDICEENLPVYNDSGTVICEDCIESYVENYWNEMSFSDKLDLLDIKKYSWKI